MILNRRRNVLDVTGGQCRSDGEDTKILGSIADSGGYYITTKPGSDMEPGICRR